MNKVEVLAPAGDVESFRAAVSHGANAINPKLANFNARAKAIYPKLAKNKARATAEEENE